jgi:Tol biopolymer transport system component
VDTNTSDVWIVDLERAVPTRFTLHSMNDISPVWAPDGERLGFRSDRTGYNILMSKPVAGGAAETAISTGDVANPTDWSPDGRYVVFHQAVATTGLDLNTFDVKSGATSSVASTVFDEYDGRISPNGRWIAYVSEESGKPDVYVQSFPRADQRRPVSAGGGAEPRWRRDGAELFYLAPDRQLMSVALKESGAGFAVSPPKALFRTNVVAYANPYQTTIEPAGDGGRFLIRSAAPRAAHGAAVTAFLNWPAEVQRRRRASVTR